MFREAKDIIISQIKGESGLVAEVCMRTLEDGPFTRELIKDFDMKFARQHKNFSNETKHTLNRYRSNIRCGATSHDSVSELLTELLYKKQLISWFSGELIRSIVYDSPLELFLEDDYLLSDVEVESDTVLDLHIRLLKSISSSAKEYFKGNQPEEQIRKVDKEIHNLTAIDRRNTTKIYSEVRKSIIALMTDNTDITSIICGYELSKINQNTSLSNSNIKTLVSKVNEASFYKSVEEYKILLSYIEERRHGKSTLISVSKLVDIKISALYFTSKFVRAIIRGAVNRNDDMVTNEKMQDLVKLFEQGVFTSDEDSMSSSGIVHGLFGRSLLTGMAILKPARGSNGNIVYDDSLHKRLGAGIRKLNRSA